MEVYIVREFIPFDSYYKILLVTVDESEAGHYAENSNWLPRTEDMQLDVTAMPLSGLDKIKTSMKQSMTAGDNSYCVQTGGDITVNDWELTPSARVRRKFW